MPRKINYTGSWSESVSTRLALPFVPESVVQVLRMGASPDTSTYCHQDIAHWCERFWNHFSDSDAIPEIERLLPVLADIECQWDLFLANTYSLCELQKLDFTAVRLPSEWFTGWLKQVEEGSAT